MDTDGACGLLFFAAKRCGAFPTNMPAWLRARVSRLGGFTRLSIFRRTIISSFRWIKKNLPANENGRLASARVALIEQLWGSTGGSIIGGTPSATARSPWRRCLSP